MALNLSSDGSTAESSHQPCAFLEFPFRPFFLLASLFSIFALLFWNALLLGLISVNTYGGSLWWHMHEMLFGFVAAIIVGFLLTAVQNWTKVRTLHGKGLMLLLSIWIIGRVLFFFPAYLPDWLIASVDIAFLPIAALALAYPIVRAKLWRNLMFIPILLLMSTANVFMHISAMTSNPLLMGQAASTMVFLVTFVMCLMGGRVFPMFTANGTQTPRVNALAWLEKLAIISTLFAVLIGSGLVDLPAIVSAAIFFIASAAHALRVLRWKIWVTFKTPLVWSLHLSYWCIALGLLLYGLSMVTGLVSHSQAIHTLTVGAMASMILAMISRVSLGHTGRAIVVGKIMTIAFMAIFLAFIIRVFGLFWLDNYQHMLTMSVLFWVIGYASFIVLYFPILTKQAANKS
ncbi:MAG: heme/copper membrane protein of NnrS family protein [Osedax symbiont Rs1]|nr:MAG: heme/copper membrane protein of NnrS family protein [Osedax symbiont Rs1]